LAIGCFISMLIGLVLIFFYDKSWWLAIGSFIGFIFFKSVMKEYYKEWKETGGVENIGE